MRSEAAYQRILIIRLQAMFPDCFIIKNDAAITQGIPDLLILLNDRWGMLEVKLSERSPIQPNQEYYINMFSEMSFASFIWPEIEEEVLHDLSSAFGAFR